MQCVSSDMIIYCVLYTLSMQLIIIMKGGRGTKKKRKKPPCLNSLAFYFLSLIFVLLLHTFPACSFKEDLMGKRELSQHLISAPVTPAILHKQAKDATHQNFLWISLFRALRNRRHPELDHSYLFSNS